MPSLNRVLLMGRLVRAPRRVASEAEPLALAALAIQRPHKGAGADFVPLEAWGERALDLLSRRQGDLIRIDGRLTLRRWVQDDQNRQALRVVVDRVELVAEPASERTNRRAAAETET